MTTLFSLNDQVKALWKGGSIFYRGKIVCVNSDDTYLIKFETGEQDKTHSRFISAIKFAVGESVKVKRIASDPNHFVHGTISQIKTADSSIYEVTFDPITKFNPEYIAEENVFTPPIYIPGDLVLVSNPLGIRYSGEICNVNNDGTYHVLVNGRKVVKNVSGKIIEFVSQFFKKNQVVRVLSRKPITHTEYGTFEAFSTFTKGVIVEVDERRSDLKVEVDGTTLVVDFQLAKSILQVRYKDQNDKLAFSTETSLSVGDIVDWKASKDLTVRCKVVSIGEKRGEDEKYVKEYKLEYKLDNDNQAIGHVFVSDEKKYVEIS